MLARRHEVRRNRVQQLVQELQALERYAEMMIPREQDSPAYYKWGLCLKDAPRRELLVQHCQRMDVPLDTGFRGFMKRSSRRCRKVGDLTHATKRAAGTVLLHHPVLLQDAKVISKLAEEVRVIFKRVFEAGGSGATRDRGQPSYRGIHRFSNCPASRICWTRVSISSWVRRSTHWHSSSARNQVS